MKANPLSFSPLPYALLEDPELKHSDKVVAALIMRWLDQEPTGWVYNGILADKSGLDPRSIARCLRRLEETLWFRCEQDSGSKSQRTIIALWRTKEGLAAIKARLGTLKGSKPADYSEYLASPEWQEKRRRAMIAAGRRCQVCNTADETLDCHHRTYRRLGHERPSDLIVLCRPCHGLFHENGKLAL